MILPDSQVHKDAVKIATESVGWHVADLVDKLTEVDDAVAIAALSFLSRDRAVEVMDHTGHERAPTLLAGLPTDRAIAMLCGMSADRVVDVLRHLDEPKRVTLLAGLAPETRNSLVRLLAWPKDSAGSIMTTEFVSVPSTFTIGETIEHIRKVVETRETIYSIFVLDPQTQHLIKSVALRRVISGDPGANILTAAAHRKPVIVDPLTDREEVARLISKYDLLAVPVVQDGHLIGIVTVDDVIDAIVEEGTEDAQKFGGMEALGKPYTEVSFLGMIKKRAGWLSVLFLSEMLTASAMQGFSDELEKAVVLTLFIPLIMSSGGNSGSQATSLLIRSLALQEVRLGDWWRIAMREIPTGAVLGAILGLLGVARITVWQTTGLFDYGPHWMLIAATVFSALVCIVTFGSLAGSMLPFILKRLGFDPASASAPFVATLVDVTGLVIYFSVALMILRGTLL